MLRKQVARHKRRTYDRSQGKSKNLIQPQEAVEIRDHGGFPRGMFKRDKLFVFPLRVWIF